MRGPRVQRCALGAQTRSARGAGACGDRRVRAGEQLLRHNGTQELERSEQEVEPLELGVGSGLAKRPDEKVRVENVLPRRGRAHRAVLSGGVIRTPSMARVPLMSSRRKRTRSSAVSIASVAVEARSTRWAAATFPGARR